MGKFRKVKVLVSVKSIKKQQDYEGQISDGQSNVLECYAKAVAENGLNTEQNNCISISALNLLLFEISISVNS